MPRLGVAYHLFGNGKTALKGSVGKFVGQEPLTLVNTSNPLSAQTDSRSWTDRDGNGTVFQTGTFIPQLNEVGASRNSNFGLAAGVPTLDPGLERPVQLAYTVAVQHELLPRLSVSGGYYRRAFYNLSQTINRAVDPVSDYTPFTIRKVRRSRRGHGNPLQDISEMLRIKFVMKGGAVFRDELPKAVARPASGEAQ